MLGFRLVDVQAGLHSSVCGVQGRHAPMRLHVPARQRHSKEMLSTNIACVAVNVGICAVWIATKSFQVMISANMSLASAKPKDIKVLCTDPRKGTIKSRHKRSGRNAFKSCRSNHHRIWMRTKDICCNWFPTWVTCRAN